MNSSPSPDPNEAVQALILDIFRERHRHNISLRDDVFRTLPFFATALGVVIATVGAIASRLPPVDQIRASWLLTAVAAVLGLALLLALVVLLLLGRITAPAKYDELATEAEILAAHGSAPGSPPATSAAALRNDMILSYANVAPRNRARNLASSRGRALAARNLIASLILTLIATGLILAAGKLALLSQVAP